jgi:hypothetical protein
VVERTVSLRPRGRLAGRPQHDTEILVVQVDAEAGPEVAGSWFAAFTVWPAPAGEIVLMSISSAPRSAALNTPSSSSTTARTPGESGSIVITASVPA